MQGLGFQGLGFIYGVQGLGLLGFRVWGVYGNNGIRAYLIGLG